MLLKVAGWRTQLEIVFMKHCAPNHALVHEDDLTR